MIGNIDSMLLDLCDFFSQKKKLNKLKGNCLIGLSSIMLWYSDGFDYWYSDGI